MDTRPRPFPSLPCGAAARGTRPATSLLPRGPWTLPLPVGGVTLPAPQLGQRYRLVKAEGEAGSPPAQAQWGAQPSEGGGGGGWRLPLLARERSAVGRLRARARWWEEPALSEGGRRPGRGEPQRPPRARGGRVPPAEAGESPPCWGGRGVVRPVSPRRRARRAGEGVLRGESAFGGAGVGVSSGWAGALRSRGAAREGAAVRSFSGPASPPHPGSCRAQRLPRRPRDLFGCFSAGRWQPAGGEWRNSCLKRKSWPCPASGCSAEG